MNANDFETKHQKMNTTQIPMMHKRRALKCLTILAALNLNAACTNIITPPANIENPTNVYVLDYGRHSSLLVPNRSASDDTLNHEFTEYAYGEWKWFAKQNDSVWRIPATLFWPTTGTLGRNIWQVRNPDDTFALNTSQSTTEKNHNARMATAVANQFQTEKVIHITVDRTAVTNLLDELNDRFKAANVQQPVYNQAYRLHFLPEPNVKYTLFHNCNNEVVDWLRELDCTVNGTGIFSTFKLKENPATYPKN